MFLPSSDVEGSTRLWEAPTPPFSDSLVLGTRPWLADQSIYGEAAADREDEAMSFGEAIRTVFHRYAELTGRAARAEFWWWALFNLLVAAALNFFNVIRIGDNAYLGSLLAGVWGIAVLLPNLAVTVRRLRDAGYGWGHLFWLLVPIAAFFVLITLLAQPTKPTVPATATA